MTDDKKQAILAELILFARENITEKIPDGAVTIDELLDGLHAEFPELGKDKSVKFVHALVEQGKLAWMRIGSRKYYYKH